MKTHALMRSLGVVALAMSLYRGFTVSVPLDDIIAILVISLAIIWLGNDLGKKKKTAKDNISETEQKFAEIEKLIATGNKITI